MKQILISFIILFLTLSLNSEQYSLPQGDYQINIPVNWDLYDSSDLNNISFLAQDQSGILQVSWFEGDQFDSTRDMYRFFTEGMDFEGEQSQFEYLDWQALLADLSFTNGPDKFRGWFLFLDGEEFDYQVFVYSPYDDYEHSFPYILSCLDSFSPGVSARRHPGVISHMFYDSRGAQYEKKVMPLGDRVFIFDYDPFELDASQVVIEREAPLLTNFTSLSPQAALAWDRYYKLIYRDNYHRLDPVYEALKPHMSGLNSTEMAVKLLSWLQGFEYGSSGTFSDLMSPLTSIVTEKGDCDSLSLAYLILLKHFDIEGILLVSEVYSHAMAAVNVEGPGISFPYGEEEYLVAELTKEVDLGLIASDMIDFSKWQPVAFE
jgi:hypothetical protein